MPRLSVFFIRTALLYLVAGFTIGGAILAQKGGAFSPSAWQLLPAHIEILFFGWTVQLIMGTAFWILPRFSKSPPRGNPQVAWLSYALLNAGVLVAVFSPLFQEPAWALLAGRLLEGMGLTAFISNAWPRVKAFGS